MPAEPRFFLISREREHALAEGEYVIGRTAASDLQVGGDQVSRTHARLTVAGDFLYVEDLQSLNGTFVNGARTSARQIMLPGDRVRFGDQEFFVRGLLGPAEHEIRTPVTSGYARLPDLHLPSVIVSQSRDDEPTMPSPDRAAPAAVLVGLGDPALAAALLRAAKARGDALPFRAVALDGLYGEIGGAGAGGLVLDVEALGPTVPDLVKAWRGPTARRDPVVLVGKMDEVQGDDMAARFGADAFVCAEARPVAAIVSAILEALGGG